MHYTKREVREEGGPMGDKVNHPEHYGGDTTYEVIKIIEAWRLNFHLGNAIKYILRSEHKGDWEENIDKAIWYLERLKKLKKEGPPT